MDLRPSTPPFPPTGNEIRVTGWRLHPAQSSTSDTSNSHEGGTYIK